MPKWLSFTIILLLGVYALILQSKDQLILYISPRYLLSATLAAVVCIVFACAGFVWLVARYGFADRMKFINRIRSTNFRNPKLVAILAALLFAYFTPLGFILLILVLLIPLSQDEKVLKVPLLIEFLVFGFILAGFVLPAQTLSSQAASQRATSLNTIAFSPELTATSLFSFDSDKYDIGDWVRRINADPNLGDYVDKKVNITGFVFKSDQLPSNMFLAARFIISCCAVDARPVGLPVKLEGWEKTFNTDEWVSVTGRFVIENINGSDVLIVVPDEAPQKIAMPTRPYIY